MSLHIHGCDVNVSVCQSCGNAFLFEFALYLLEVVVFLCQSVCERGHLNYPASVSELKWSPLEARSIISTPIVSSQRCVEIVLLTGRS